MWQIEGTLRWCQHSVSEKEGETTFLGEPHHRPSTLDISLCFFPSVFFFPLWMGSWFLRHFLFFTFWCFFFFFIFRKERFTRELHQVLSSHHPCLHPLHPKDLSAFLSIFYCIFLTSSAEILPLLWFYFILFLKPGILFEFIQVKNICLIVDLENEALLCECW